MSNSNDMNIYKEKYYSEGKMEESPEEGEQEAANEGGNFDEGLSTLRRSSAFLFENLSKEFQDELFGLLQGHLEASL